MRKFIIKLLLFTFIFGFALILSSILAYKIVASKTDYSISKNIDKLVIGDSHPECAYNDSLINNFINVASSGSSYFYNYYFLKPLLNHNGHIKTVFIEFSNNQVSAENDAWIFGDNYLPFKLQVLGANIDKEGLALLVRKNMGGVFNGYIKFLRQQIKIIATSNYKYLYNKGGYNYLVRNKVDENFNNQTVDSTKKEKTPITELNLKYFEKVILYCKSKNIKVYLIRSPLHPKYLGFYNEQEYQKHIQTRFKDTEFLDFKNFSLTNEEFGDFGHLNFKGARKFSIWFNSLLEQGLLTQQNKQEFINKNFGS
jgi:hypothetical protein